MKANVSVFQTYASTSKFVCVFRGSHRVFGGHNIYTGSRRTFLHPLFSGSCYRYIYCLMLIVGVTSVLDRVELPSLLHVGDQKTT